jgi:serine beta-lactamase-like protein LACTB
MRLVRTSARLASALLVAPLASATPLLAQAVAEAPAPARYGAAIEAGRRAVADVMAEHAIPGMSAAVLIDGEIVWSEGFGFADLENRVPATPLTRFRIGSISKPVSASALAKLSQEGRLDLDAPVQRYVPYFPAKRWPVTPRLVAGHLAGIRHYRGDENLSNRRYETVREGLSIFQGDPLLHEPGTQYLYSSYGWNLLSAVVEGASGQDFLSYMREQIFAPLNLRSIVAEHTDSVIPYRAEFYVRGDDGRVLNAPYVDNSYKWAGGGFISNTEDLVRFGWVHLDGSFLQPEAVKALFTSQRTRAGESTNYGIGWRSGTDKAGRRWVGHTGSSVGGWAVLVVYPEERVVVAALANQDEQPDRQALAERIATPFIDAKQLEVTR